MNLLAHPSMHTARRGFATGEHTSRIGLAERTNIGAFLPWVAVPAISLLRAEQSTASTL